MAETETGKVIAFVKDPQFMVCDDCEGDVFEIQTAHDNPNNIIRIHCANEECGSYWDAETPLDQQKAGDK